MPSVYGLASAQRALGHEVSLWYDTKRGSMGESKNPHSQLLSLNSRISRSRCQQRVHR